MLSYGSYRRKSGLNTRILCCDFCEVVWCQLNKISIYWKAGNLILDQENSKTITDLIGEGHETIDESPAFNMITNQICCQAQAGN